MDDSPADPIHDVETEIATLFANGRRITQKAARTVHPDLHPSGLYLIRMLQKQGPSRPSVIAEYFEVDRSAISRLITSLESLGLIERQADPADKRAQMLALTAEGISRLGHLASSMDSPLRARLKDWAPEDLVTLARLLARLNEDAV
jgi:DNA-binding MarR family transcriptional regulator